MVCSACFASRETFRPGYVAYAVPYYSMCFNGCALRVLDEKDDISIGVTGVYLQREGYSSRFRDDYCTTMGALQHSISGHAPTGKAASIRASFLQFPPRLSDATASLIHKGARVTRHCPFVDASFSFLCTRTRRTAASETTRCAYIAVLLFSFDSPSNLSVPLSQSSHGSFSIAPPQLLEFELGPRVRLRWKVGVVRANHILTRLAGANGTSAVAGKAVCKTRSGREGSKEVVGWHWHVFALHLEAHYSSILYVQRKK